MLSEKDEAKRKRLSEYYCEVRKRRFEQGISIKPISIIGRKLIHPILYCLIILDRLSVGEKLRVIGDKRSSTKNVIYACTHIGGQDVQRVFEAIKSHAYLFLGDPGILYWGVLGTITYLNGAIYLETRDKYDRKIASERAVELLNYGGSLLIFPEGAWNIEPSAPVMGIFGGAIRMARRSGCDIVPVAVELYENTYIVNIGENYKCIEKMNENSQIACLRDKMATLKWEIWERQGIDNRAHMAVISDTEYAESVMNRANYGYTLQDVYETRWQKKQEK